MSNNSDNPSVSETQHVERSHKFQYLRLQHCERREDGEWYYDPWSNDAMFEVDTAPILKICEDHGLLFTEKNLRHIQNELSMVEKNNDIYTAIDIFGKEHIAKVDASQPNLKDGEIWKYQVDYNFLCHLADTRFAGYHTVGNSAEEVAALTISKDPWKAAAIEDCTGNGLQDDGRFASWTSEWEQSPIREELCSFLEEHASKMKQVRKIVCFGLGCVAPRGGDEDRWWKDWWKGHYEQHLMALTIRDTLKKYGHPVAIVFAQDPAYCNVGTKYIESTFGIKVLPDMGGIMEVDEHTFVFTYAAGIPVMQICTHKTWPKGVAGMFNHPITKDGTVKKQAYTTEHMDIYGWEGYGSPTTDDPDPYVYEWAQKYQGKILRPLVLGEDAGMAIYVQPQSPSQSPSATTSDT
ncbi:hypothetical protein DM02DRAFT_688639 [Periconia macrospinosa]|uniref:SRR1-like domain-containing protein n=1 Tax=Periconia macrospinosa TaxID=97972 RepID=A0A2V1DD91_9PLEO|nr:hypothetical protein DM02DRAFT_688639 [Periconia macrospinosa]